MPYFLDGKCVRKGTKNNPGEVVKCHATKAKAKAHLAALVINVPDAVTKGLQALKGIGFITTAEFGGMLALLPHAQVYDDAMQALHKRFETLQGVHSNLYRLATMYSRHAGNYFEVDGGTLGDVFDLKIKEALQHRWVLTSTYEMVDLQGETFTTDAIDFSIWYANKFNEFPELRMYHVRAFKLGMTDKMQRLGRWEVDQGYWNKTAFAHAVKRLVREQAGKWKVSKGFFSVEATGDCPMCDNGLIVRPINYILGITCKQCQAVLPKPITMIQHVRHTKAITYDNTVTDVPAVPVTAIAAYTIS